jgi:hypothetical protein
MFYLASIQRHVIAMGYKPNFDSLMRGVSQFNLGVAVEVVESIFYRFSSGGLDQFFLIFKSYIVEGFDFPSMYHFLVYLLKNTVNLLLPGTQFPEAYAPSSQIFPQLIWKNITGWAGGADSFALIKAFNTQPYGLFGMGIVMFGYLGPLFLLFFTYALITLHNVFQNVYVQITIIYFFAGILPSYGFETAIGNSTHLLISMYIMIFLMRFMSRISLRQILRGFLSKRRVAEPNE